MATYMPYNKPMANVLNGITATLKAFVDGAELDASSTPLSVYENR
jgi:hypothetical protein